MPTLEEMRQDCALRGCQIECLIQSDGGPWPSAVATYIHVQTDASMVELQERWEDQSHRARVDAWRRSLHKED